MKDRDPFDLQHVILTGGEEEMLGQDEPKAPRMFQQVFAYSGYVEETLAMTAELGGQKQVMENGQWLEVMFVENFIDRVKLIGSEKRPVEGFGGPGHEVALHCPVGCEANWSSFDEMA